MAIVKYTTVEQYLAAQPQHARALLEELRATIRQMVPAAEEVISYSIPAFRYHGLLVWYAGFKEHIGFYPHANVIEAFKEELVPYKFAKGSVQFPLDKPLPLPLIKRMIKYRLKEHTAKAAEKAKKKKAGSRAK